MNLKSFAFAIFFSFFLSESPFDNPLSAFLRRFLIYDFWRPRKLLQKNDCSRRFWVHYLKFNSKKRKIWNAVGCRREGTCSTNLDFNDEKKKRKKKLNSFAILLWNYNEKEVYLFLTENWQENFENWFYFMWKIKYKAENIHLQRLSRSMIRKIFTHS